MKNIGHNTIRTLVMFLFTFGMNSVNSQMLGLVDIGVNQTQNEIVSGLTQKGWKLKERFSNTVTFNAFDQESKSDLELVIFVNDDENPKVSEVQIHANGPSSLPIFANWARKLRDRVGPPISKSKQGNLVSEVYCPHAGVAAVLQLDDIRANLAFTTGPNVKYCGSVSRSYPPGALWLQVAPTNLSQQRSNAQAQAPQHSAQEQLLPVVSAPSSPAPKAVFAPRAPNSPLPSPKARGVRAEGFFGVPGFNIGMSLKEAKIAFRERFPSSLETSGRLIANPQVSELTGEMVEPDVMWQTLIRLHFESEQETSKLMEVTLSNEGWTRSNDDRAKGVAHISNLIQQLDLPILSEEIVATSNDGPTKVQFYCFSPDASLRVLTSSYRSGAPFQSIVTFSFREARADKRCPTGKYKGVTGLPLLAIPTEKYIQQYRAAVNKKAVDEIERIRRDRASGDDMKQSCARITGSDGRSFDHCVWVPR
jgi:hypothetical protein